MFLSAVVIVYVVITDTNVYKCAFPLNIERGCRKICFTAGGRKSSKWRKASLVMYWVTEGRWGLLSGFKEAGREALKKHFPVEAHWLSIFCRSDTFKMPSQSRVQCFICFCITFELKIKTTSILKKTKLGCLFKHNKDFYSLTLHLGVFSWPLCSDGESVCSSLGVVATMLTGIKHAVGFVHLEGGKMSLYLLNKQAWLLHSMWLIKGFLLTFLDITFSHFILLFPTKSYILSHVPCLGLSEAVMEWYWTKH